MPAFVVPIYPASGVGRPGELADVVGKFAEAQIAFAQRLLAGSYYSFGALAFGDVLRNYIDPDHFPVGVLRRMPICNPDVVGIELVDTLTANFDAGNRLTGIHDRLNELFNLLRHLRNGLADRSPDMIGD